jgi:tetratricopeptide (TPR) repeat protein
MSRQSKNPVSEQVAHSVTAPDRWSVIIICLVLAALVWIVFGQTLHHDFVDYDDLDYVTKNAQVSRGLSWEGILWAFTHVHSSNWHPLTWISHMIDCQLFGLDPAGHHFTNVLLHSANAILLFLLVRQMTGTLWPSALVAALFAIHPLRVESVAWIAERKDVLSGLFFFLTLMAYVRYARGPSRSRYLAVVIFFVLGLMSKPMLVSVPVVLLLLDYWPLNRLEGKRDIWPRVREKLPLIALAIGSSVITVFAQSGSLQPITHITLSQRLSNVAISYLDYLRQLFWPQDLAVLYPWVPEERVQPLLVAISILLLLAVSAGAIILRRHRSFITSWLWYLIMLLPVIGIVHVGNQSHADRYTYLPQIGIYLILVWAAVELVAHWRFMLAPIAALAAACVIALTFTARVQAGHWQDSESLWRHALAATTDNIIAEGNLALALHWKGNDREAMEHFEQSLSINRQQPEILSNLGTFYLELGRVQDSIAVLKEALALEPRFEDAHYNLGNTYLQIGNAREAVHEYRRALEIEPDDTQALNNTAWILATWPDSMVRNGSEAVVLAERADSLTNRQNQVIAATLAAAYAEAGRLPEAVRTGERALSLAVKEKNEARALAIKAQLDTYKSGSAYRDTRYR